MGKAVCWERQEHQRFSREKQRNYWSRALDTPAKRRLIDFVESSAEARRLTWAELIHHQGLNCSTRTIQRYLHGAGFRRCLAIPKPWLTEKQKEACLAWAHEHADWDFIDWGRVIWTDESAIHTGGKKEVYVTRRTNQQFFPDFLRPKFPKPHFTMIWGAIIDGQVDPMVLWDKQVWGNITPTGFVEYIFPVSITICINYLTCI